MFSSKEKYSEARLWHIGVFGIVCLVAFGLLVWSKRTPTIRIMIHEKHFTVLLADTPDRWLKGLSGRKDIGAYDGMLFVFPDFETRSLVMRDMLFPLDVIWINGDTIVDIQTDLVPDAQEESKLTQYTPDSLANSVLEVPAGFVEAQDIKIGDRVLVAP